MIFVVVQLDCLIAGWQKYQNVEGQCRECSKRSRRVTRGVRILICHWKGQQLRDEGRIRPGAPGFFWERPNSLWSQQGPQLVGDSSTDESEARSQLTTDCCSFQTFSVSRCHRSGLEQSCPDSYRLPAFIGAVTAPPQSPRTAWLLYNSFPGNVSRKKILTLWVQ